MANDTKKAALKSKMNETFEKNPFAKKYKESNEIRGKSRDWEAHKSGTPSYLSRAKGSKVRRDLQGRTSSLGK